MKVLIRLYGECKYWDGVRIKKETEYCVTGYEEQWYSDDEATKMGITDIDEAGEYLFLHLENGETVTFCNTHVDLYVLG